MDCSLDRLHVPPLRPFAPSALVTLNSFSNLWGYLSFFLLSTGKNVVNVETF